MQKPKNLNLVIDGNYLFHKTLAVYFSPDAQAGQPKLTSEEDRAFYARKVIIDFCSGIREFYSINLNSIICTIDSRSWRKDVQIEENDGYKSNRVKGTGINWDGFYEVMNEVTEIFKNHGIYISKVRKAEGDDLMYLFADRFFKQGEDTIVMTGDKDMWQIIKNENDNFISIFVNNSKYSKIVVTEEIEKLLRPKELEFNADKVNEMVFEAGGLSNVKNLAKMLNHKIKPEVINPTKHAFIKIFAGDSGDGVPPAYVWTTYTKKTGEPKRNYFTEKRLENIWQYMNSKYKERELIYALPKEIEFIHNDINRISKGCLSKDGITQEQLAEKIKRNTQLMYLDLDVLPESIKEDFNIEFDKIFSKMKYVFTKFNLDDFRVQNLIVDTKYGTASETSSADFFKGSTVKFDKDDFFADEEDKVKLL